MKSKIIAIVGLMLMPLSAMAGNYKVKFSNKNQDEKTHRILTIVDLKGVEYSSINVSEPLASVGDADIIAFRSQLGILTQKYLDMSNCIDEPYYNGIIHKKDAFDQEKFADLKSCLAHVATEANKFALSILNQKKQFHYSLSN